MKILSRQTCMINSAFLKEHLDNRMESAFNSRPKKKKKKSKERG